jgi:hypothetical protein
MADQDHDNPADIPGESTPPDPPAVIRHYFVDEAGDGTLFNRHGRSVVGTEGCSQFFFLGLLDVADPKVLEAQLSELRAALLADPYLKKIPSMQPEQRKTALAFHAKDDCPEVRREVFRLLVQHEVRFFALVRDKAVILRKVQEHNARNPEYRYHPNQLYDRCVSRLFRDRLHKDDGYAVHFSKRGNKSRTDAMRKALEQARANFRHKFQVESTAPIEILAAVPANAPGLQAVDYFLWALQRLYERGEDRYWEYVAERVSLVHDVDDTRSAEYGAYYTKRNPLTLERLPKKE